MAMENVHPNKYTKVTSTGTNIYHLRNREIIDSNVSWDGICDRSPEGTHTL